MSNTWKRACWPSFFVILALIFALLISSIEGFIFWWAGLACLIAAVIIGLPKPFNWTSLSISVVIYVGYLLLNVFLLSPAFTAKGLYFVCYFAAGFVVFSGLSQHHIEQVFKLTVIIFIFISLWAVIQYISGLGYLVRAWPRVNTIFYTPNTFAAALNLVLLPLISVYLYKIKKNPVYLTILLLFTVLVLTQSRGGWLAFLAGIGAIWISGRISSEYRVNKHVWLKLAAGFFIIIFVILLTRGLMPLTRYSGKFETNMFETNMLDSITSIVRLNNEVSSGTERIKLYNTAWQHIKERPLLGNGYNHFQYYQLSDQPLSRKGIQTKFVHNDYLQIWMETGIIGLMFLFSIVFLFYRSLLKYIKSGSSQYKIYIVSLVGGMTAYYAHANVDFVMYPPVLLLMSGAYLGITNSLVAPASMSFKKFDWSQLKKLDIRPVVIRAVLGMFLILWLSQPAFAQLAFEKARRDAQSLDIKSALKYFELARRFAPYEPVYYSAEGNIWYHAALVTKKSEPARRADTMLARGAEVNPYQVGNLFLRALLHRDVPELLSDPASLDTVLSWLEYVMKWLPHDNLVQVEYIKTLHKAGRDEDVVRLLAEYSRSYPKSVLIKKTRDYYMNLLK